MYWQPDTHLSHTSDAALFDAYGGVIFSYVRSRTSSREDAEDLTFDVFATALEQDNLSAFRTEPERLVWLKRLAHNKVIDHYRRTQRHPLLTIDPFADFLLDEQADPEESAMRSEEQNELYNYIQQLPALQQHVIQLRYGHQLRHSEIAVLLKKREGAIRKLLSRTLQQIRSLSIKKRERSDKHEEL